MGNGVSQPDPTDGPRRLLWEAIQLLRGAPSITARQDAAIRLVDRRIDEFEAALRVVPPEEDWWTKHPKQPDADGHCLRCGEEWDPNDIGSHECPPAFIPPTESRPNE